MTTRTNGRGKTSFYRGCLSHLALLTLNHLPSLSSRGFSNKMQTRSAFTIMSRTYLPEPSGSSMLGSISTGASASGLRIPRTIVEHGGSLYGEARRGFVASDGRFGGWGSPGWQGMTKSIMRREHSWRGRWTGWTRLRWDREPWPRIREQPLWIIAGSQPNLRSGLALHFQLEFVPLSTRKCFHSQWYRTRRDHFRWYSVSIVALP